MKIGNCIANICACYLICITWLRVKPNEAALRGQPLSRRPCVNTFATYAALVSRRYTICLSKVGKPGKIN